MSDFSGIAQAAVQLHDEMRQAQNDVKARELRSAEEASRAFHVAMEDARKTRSNERVTAAREVNNKAAAKTTLETAMQSAKNGLPNQIGQAAKSERHRLFEIIKHVVAGQDKMGEIIQEALSGKQFLGPEILQMQCAVFRYAQELEYTVKIVEKTDSGVKQLFNTQLGGG